MKFSNINANIIGKKVKLLSIKNSNLTENSIIKKNGVYKIYDIDKNYFNSENLTIRLVDENYNIFWVNHYDIELLEDIDKEK